MKKQQPQFNKHSNYSQDEQRFGFVDVRPLNNANGGEQFGVIELAPAYAAVIAPPPNKTRRHRQPASLLTAGLRLSGANLNLWLSDDRREREFWQGLAAALPDDPVQFVLKRRQASLDAHYMGVKAVVAERLTDPGVRFAFLEDYLENFVYPSEDANPVELWAGILVSGRGEAEVSARLAALFAALSTLGCDTTPLNSADLTALLLDYFNPCAPDDELAAVSEGELPLVEPAIGENAIYTGLAQCFWKIAAPPSPREGGWVRAILEQTPRQADFDLVAHLAPTSDKSNMHEVLERRLAKLEDQLQQALTSGDGVLYHDLEAKRADMLSRLETLENGTERYFEVGLTLSLRAETADFEQLSQIFADKLHAAGIALHLVEKAAQVEAAWHACAPLNLGRLPRTFVVPSVEAGRLAQLATTAVTSGNPLKTAVSAAPLLGLNQAGEPLAFETTSATSQTTLFFTGNRGAASVQPARNLVKYLAAMRYLSGEALLGFDPSGDWRRLTYQLGGTYIGFGPENKAIWHYNPLQFIGLPQGSDTLQLVEEWSKQSAAFLATLLDLNSSRPIEPQSESLSEQLHTLLIELAFNNCMLGDEADEVLTAARLHKAAVASGCTELAQHLARCTNNGDLAWLFERPTKLAPALTAQDSDLLFLGFSVQAETCLSQAARTQIMARVFAYYTDIPAISTNLAAKPRLLVLDNAATLLSDAQANNCLGRMFKGLARRRALNLWCVGEGPGDWLACQVGQQALEQSDKLFFFNQSGPGVVGAAKRLGLPIRAQRTMRDLRAGGAIVATRVAAGNYQLEMFAPVAQQYITRLSQAPARKQLPMPAQTAANSTQTKTAAPKIEVAPVIVMSQKEAPVTPAAASIEEQPLRIGA